MKKSFLLFVLNLIGIMILGQDYQLPHSQYYLGALVRGDSTQSTIYLTFTGGDYNDGRSHIYNCLSEKQIRAHFFFTGDFYRNPENSKLIRELIRDGHYLGPHSDKHLLYASWENRDSLLVNRKLFRRDLKQNMKAMKAYGITRKQISYYMPPYEWYNQTISDWTHKMGLQLINFSPGTRSNADYTTPDMGNRYLDTKTIYRSILDFEKNSKKGLNGFILLLHIGTHPDRTDKFYYRLSELIDDLRARGYRFELLPGVDLSPTQ